MTSLHLRVLSNNALAAVVAAITESSIEGCDDVLADTTRGVLLEYLSECLKRCSGSRFKDLFLSHDFGRILAELAERVDP